MKKNNIIRKISALALLMLFVLSNMPKQWLHDAFANHTDCKKSLSLEKKLQISKQGYNCDCDALVIETPFAPAAEYCINLLDLSVRSTFTPVKNKNLPALQHFFFQLRGPPSLA